jgi:hypothetical protein
MEEPKYTGKDEKGRFTAKNTWQLARKTFSGGVSWRFETPEDFLQKALDYFQWAEENQKGKLAFADMRIFMGLPDKDSFKATRNRSPEFKEAYDLVMSIHEGDAEKKLGWAGTVQGAIFRLKNSHGWSDESTKNVNVTEVKAKFGE